MTIETEWLSYDVIVVGSGGAEHKLLLQLQSWVQVFY